METFVFLEFDQTSVSFLRKELLSERDGNKFPTFYKVGGLYLHLGRNFSLEEMETLLGQLL